ncbi:MAG: DegT/DnrJ/EryC1/StrS family aminotransferase [Desulfobacterales bacterium]|jgi:dTDP-4-amino-4,6-dideoxygalactose transaminase
MQFIDLARQQKRIKDKIDANIAAILDHGKYIMGPEIGILENRLAEYSGVNHAIGCASGTDALLMALLAKQIGPGDAVFTSPFTFIATAEVISLLGATPVFVDIDPQTFNMDPVQLQHAIQAVEKNDPSIYPVPKINATSRHSATILSPKGILAVDLFGLTADYIRIGAIAEEHHLFVIEDAAQSFGAELNNKKAGAFGNIGCTSFFPAKPLGGYGDGGMCFTNDDHLAEIMGSVRVHGKGHHKYDNVRIGVNGRLDTIQAGILLAKFDIFPEEIELRQQVANHYKSLLQPLPKIQAPTIPQGYKSAWAQYSVLTTDETQRTALQNKLKEADIPTAIYYPKPLHLQSAFAGLGYRKGDFPISEDISRRIFSLPMHPYLAEAAQQKIAEVIGATVAGQ